MATKKSKPPSGGKKGGAVFPRFGLEAAVAAAKRLVSKSHAAPVPKDIYFSGVLQVSGPRAEIKSSSLKQYGLLMGNAKGGFSASALAKRIANSDGTETAEAMKKAALSPKIFKGIFDAFHGDTVAKSRLKQRAAELNVHPDALDTCVKIYLESLELAGLLNLSGDQVTHVASSDAPAAVAVDPAEMVDNEDSPQRDEGAGAHTSQPESVQKSQMRTRSTGAAINVTITLDSTLDTDKLEKQLALLKKYGAI